MNELDSTVVSLALDAATGAHRPHRREAGSAAEAARRPIIAPTSRSRRTGGSSTARTAAMIPSLSSAVDQQSGKLSLGRLCALRRLDAAQSVPHADRRASVLRQPERRPHHDLLTRRQKRHLCRHRPCHRNRHADVRQDRQAGQRTGSPTSTTRLRATVCAKPGSTVSPLRNIYCAVVFVRIIVTLFLVRQSGLCRRAVAPDHRVFNRRELSRIVEVADPVAGHQARQKAYPFARFLGIPEIDDN